MIDYIAEIEEWAKKGVYIDFIIIDQLQDDKKSVEDGIAPPYTYTVHVNDGFDFVSQLGYNDLREGLEEAFEFAKKNYSDREYIENKYFEEIKLGLEQAIKIEKQNKKWESLKK